MHTDTQGFFDNPTASTTGLRGVGGVHKRNVATSIYRFVAQQRLERAESSIVSRQGQVSIASHKGQVEVFECNQAVGMHQPMSQLVPEIAALVGNMLMQLRDHQP